MLSFLRNAHKRTPTPPPWIDWTANPFRRSITLTLNHHPYNTNPINPKCRTTPTVVQPVEVRVRTVRRSSKRGYVPLGHDPQNKGGRVCNCGSTTHVTRTHNMCPLNEDYWPQLPREKHRLSLYVPRQIWRWWSYEDNDKRRCEGSVTHVTDDLKLHIAYEDDGSEDVDEKTFLDIVSIMKKDNKKKKKQK